MAENTSATFWLSGLVNGKFIACDGPYTAPKEIMTSYPRVITPPDPNLTYQQYDYTTGKWVSTETAEFTKRVEALQEDVSNVKQANQTLAQSVKSDQEANQSNQTQTIKQMNQVIQMMTMMNANLGQVMKTLNANTAKTTDTTTQGGNN